VTRRFSVLDAVAATDALNASFATMRLPAGSGAQLRYAHAELRVAEEVRDFATRQAMIARQANADIAELEAKHDYLSELGREITERYGPDGQDRPSRCQLPHGSWHRLSTVPHRPTGEDIRELSPARPRRRTAEFRVR
jgi:hypothetical protein